MAQVTIRINGYAYTVGCQDGEEDHLLAMAGEVERRIDSIRTAAGPSGEARMLVMAALLMADDLFEAQKAAADAPADAAPKAARPDTKLARRLGKLAERAEAIAAEVDPS